MWQTVGDVPEYSGLFLLFVRLQPLADASIPGLQDTCRPCRKGTESGRKQGEQSAADNLTKVKHRLFRPPPVTYSHP